MWKNGHVHTHSVRTGSLTSVHERRGCDTHTVGERERGWKVWERVGGGVTYPVRQPSFYVGLAVYVHVLNKVTV